MMLRLSRKPPLKSLQMQPSMTIHISRGLPRSPKTKSTLLSFQSRIKKTIIQLQWTLSRCSDTLQLRKCITPFLNSLKPLWFHSMNQHLLYLSRDNINPKNGDTMIHWFIAEAPSPRISKDHMVYGTTLSTSEFKNRVLL